MEGLPCVASSARPPGSAPAAAATSPGQRPDEGERRARGRKDGVQGAALRAGAHREPPDGCKRLWPL